MLVIYLSRHSFGNIKREPYWGGKQKFSSDVRNNVGLQPITNMIFRNPAHIVLDEAGIIKEEFDHHSQIQ